MLNVAYFTLYYLMQKNSFFGIAPISTHNNCLDRKFINTLFNHYRVMTGHDGMFTLLINTILMNAESSLIEFCWPMQQKTICDKNC